MCPLAHTFYTCTTPFNESGYGPETDFGSMRPDHQTTRNLTFCHEIILLTIMSCIGGNFCNEEIFTPSPRVYLEGYIIAWVRELYSVKVVSSYVCQPNHSYVDFMFHLHSDLTRGCVVAMCCTVSGQTGPPREYPTVLFIDLTHLHIFHKIMYVLVQHLSSIYYVL